MLEQAALGSLALSLTFTANDDKSLVVEEFGVNEVSGAEVYACPCSGLGGADSVDCVNGGTKDVYLGAMSQ